MLTVEMRPLTAIQPYEHNPRINKKAVDAVAHSLRTFGFRQPIVVDSEGIIVCGHTRFKAAQLLNLAEVPVHVATDLTPEQTKAYRIADNKSAELAEWDMDLLPIELSDLQTGGFDMESIGFDTDELVRLLDTDINDGHTDPDEVPDIAEETLTQPGDIWQLGTHRLLCGDSAQSDSYARLLNGETADLLLTDPPYNVAYQGGTANALTIANDDMDAASYHQFLVDCLGAAAAVMKPGGSFYIWHADTYGGTVRAACDAVALPVRQCLIWKKNTLVLGRQDYQWMHEPCLYGWKPGATHNWLGDRRQTTVLEHDKPQRNGAHPTMKPVALLVEQMRNSSRPGERVLDPFGGSGSTLIACEQTGRHARVIELDPHYCDVIIKRWEHFSGKQAVRLAASTHTPAAAEALVGSEA